MVGGGEKRRRGRVNRLSNVSAEKWLSQNTCPIDEDFCVNSITIDQILIGFFFSCVRYDHANIIKV